MPQPIKLRARIENIETHAPDVRTFVMVPERPVPRFRPGQFLHLAIDAFDPSQHWPDSRVFSIASPPDDRQRLRITVSAVGAFTKRMMSLAVGDQVWVKLPYGDFVVQADSGVPVILLAGGTGITPFVSFLAGAPPVGPVRVLYGARRSDLLIYRDVVQRAAESSPLVSWQAFVEEHAGADERAGRLTVEAALDAARDTGAGDAAVFYLAGPPAMLALFRSGLAAAGTPPERVRTDAWE